MAIPPAHIYAAIAKSLRFFGCNGVKIKDTHEAMIAGIEDQVWADTIREGASDAEVAKVVAAINDLIRSNQMTRRSVVLVCVQILARTLVTTPAYVTPEIKRGIKRGVMSLIDEFMMRYAMLEGRE
jgi:hypothetical protein